MIVNLLAYGTILEYFDFISFPLVYKYIPFAGSTTVYVQFCLGYGSRLLGSLIAPYISMHDEIKLLIVSIFTITIATFLIGLLPNTPLSFYALIFLRIIQGLAFAIEFPTGASIATKAGKVSQVVNGATVGYIFASTSFAIISTFLTEAQLMSFGWRIPFLIGGYGGSRLLAARLKLYYGSTVHSTLLPWIISMISIIRLGVPKTWTFGLIVIFQIIPLLFIRSLNINLQLLISTSICIIGAFAAINLPQNIAGIAVVTQHPVPNLLTLFFSMLAVFFIPFCLRYMTSTLHGVNSSNFWLSILKLCRPEGLLSFALLRYALLHGMFQSYCVSSIPSLSSMHIISLIFSVFISRFYELGGQAKIINRIFMIIPVDLVMRYYFNYSPIRHLYNLCISLRPALGLQLILILNQAFISIAMINGLRLIRKVLDKYRYLMPICYNSISFLASMNLQNLALANHTPSLLRVMPELNISLIYDLSKWSLLLLYL